MDWSLFACARQGHVTYAPDEPELRDRLTAPTAGGPAWRCLRVYDLTVKITWLRLGALAINLLLVIYLVWSKRLFGVRGGKAAHESRLRSESFIEVEQAALAAASRPGADMPH